MREMCEMPSVKVAKHVRNMCETCEMPSVKVAKHARNVREASRNMCETSRPPRHILAVHRYADQRRQQQAGRIPSSQVSGVH